jgi:CBS domain containing-hemolysin-like protein
VVDIAFHTAIIVALILLDGLFAMSDTALVSSHKARLGQRAESACLAWWLNNATSGYLVASAMPSGVTTKYL